MLALAHPAGEFPIGDDWSFGWSVKRLGETGELRLSHWTAMTLVGQVLWARLFTLLGGFSWEVLRVSTQVLAVAGVASVFVMLRRAGGGLTTAWLGALLLAANPVWFGLSNTFMTDVPFAAFAAASALFSLRALKTRRCGDLLAATALALAATSIRQIGVVLPLAFGLILLYRDGWRPGTLLRASAPALVVGLAYAAWLLWLRLAGAAPDTYFAKYVELAASLGDIGVVGRALSRLGYVSLMLGLFVAPFLLLRFGAVRRTLAQEAGTNHRVFIAVLLVLTVFLLAKRRDLPLLSSILFDLGVLPVLLHDVWTLKLPHWPRAPLVVWPAAMALAAGSASIVVTLVMQGVRQALWRRRVGCAGPEDVAFAYGLALLALATPPLLPLHMFDRYLLLPLVLLLYLLSTLLARAPPAQAEPAGAAALDRLMRTAGAVLLGGAVVFSVAATHDFFAMSRARWAAIDGLMAAGVPAGSIAGGFEFANWQWLEHRIRPAAEPDFVIALGPFPGFREQTAVPFERWLSVERSAILILAREDRAP